MTSKSGMNAGIRSYSKRVRPPMRVGSIVLSAVNFLIMLFLLAPVIIVVISSFSSEAYSVFPPRGLSLRWYYAFFQSVEFTQSLKLSLMVGGLTTLLSLGLGIPVALVLVRHRFASKDLLGSVFLSPIFFPTIVLGIALLVFFSRINFSGTFASVLMAHVVVTTPYVIRTISSSLYGFRESLEEAAMNLGANRITTFFSVTLPLIKPGVIAAAVFAFIVSFDELVITLFLAGPRMTTLPIRIYSYLEYTSDPTIAAISTVLITVVGFVVCLVPKEFLSSLAGTGR